MKTFYKLCSMLLCSAFLLGGCTKETQTDGGDPRPGDDSIAEVREVMMTLKSQLVLQKGATKANATDATTTKAETSIATAAENAISTLDVYVFGAESENGDYTFLERFAYRADSNDKLPKDAKELQPNTTGADGKETTALIKLKKGLFVKLYCIANDTTLVDPATDKVVKAADFTPITFTESEDGTPRFAAEGKPQESTFVGWHTRLLTATAKADTLVTPLAMAGACTTPIDLTSFDNSARVQVGFRLTRLVARFDINNKAGDSRFTIETVSMGNGRRGSGLFPIRVYGNLPEAEPDQLITYPVHAFYGDNANNGLCTGAFYAYPSPRQDKAFLILNGKYKVNETEMKNVSYQIPFTQPTADGNAAWLDIAGNHRYTIAVTKADAYHLDANILVTDWADDGSIEYTPDNKPGGIVVTIPEAFKDDSEYDADTKTVSMSLKEGSSFEITTTSNSALIISKAYAGGGIVKGYDWISISDPDITLGANGISTYKYTATLTKPYLAGRYPKAAIRCISLTDASESILYVEALSVPQPIATQQPPKTPNNRSDNPNNFDVDKLEASLYRITGSTTRVYINCPDGVEPAEHPDWLDVTPASVDGASTLFLLTLNNRDLPVDGNQGTVVFCNKKKNELQTGITVNIMDAPVKTDYTAVGSDNTYTPGTSDGTTPDDLAIRIKENSSATVKASSIDGVEVKIDYPKGTPEWLSFTGATAATAVATKATASLRTQDITFKPIERSMGDAQKATVTLVNIIGGKNYSFTVTPVYATPVLSVISTSAKPAQNTFVAGDDASTLTLYRVSGSTIQLKATAIGGSRATDPAGVTVSGGDTYQTENTYTVTLAAGATSGSFNIVNKSDPAKIHTVTVSAPDPTLKLDKTEVTLTPSNGTVQTLKLTSGAGYKSYSVAWGGGTQWFSLPATVAGGTNVDLNVTANTANTNPKEATVTLTNAVDGVANATFKVKVGATAPKVTSYSNPSITTATAVSANTGSGTTIELWAIDNSSIQVTIDAIGGSCVSGTPSNVKVTGGNTTNQQNTFTITSTNGNQGSFVIANKVAPNLDKLTFTVKKKADAITANNLSVTAALSGATNISVNSSFGCTASVLNNNWGSGGGEWFQFNTADVNYGNNKTIQIKQLSTNNNTVMKPVTIRLTSKASGGVTKDITVTPTGFVAPTLSATSGSIAALAKNNVIIPLKTTFTFTKPAGNIGTISSSNTNVATVSVSGTTVTVTAKGNDSSTITIPNGTDTNKKSTYNLTVGGNANLYNGKQVWYYYGYMIAPEDAGSSTWNTNLTATYCSNKSGATWYVPSADEWRTILGGTSGSNHAADAVCQEYIGKGVFASGSTCYWSTTTYNITNAYEVYFGSYANVYWYYKTNSRQVRCVAR